MNNSDKWDELGLQLAVVDFADCRTLLLHGELDVAVRGAQEVEFARLVTEAPTKAVIIDLSGVSFCDSSGVSILVKAAHRMRTLGGRVHLASPQPWVGKVLAVTGVGQAIPMFATCKEAYDALCDSPGPASENTP